MAEDDKKDETTAGLKFGDLTKLIEDTVAKIVGPGDKTGEDKKSDDKVAEGGSVANLVREQIEAIRRGEKEQEEKNNLKKDIEELKSATQEKAPVERRRVHKLMGWGENADR